MPSKGVQARDVDRPPLCPGCGRELPKLYIAIPESMTLGWEGMQWIEQRLLVGIFTDHAQADLGTKSRGAFGEWDPLAIAERSLMTYRQAHNALRRLVPTGWVQRVRRGVYRLTPHAVEQLREHIRPTESISHFRAGKKNKSKSVRTRPRTRTAHRRSP